MTGNIDMEGSSWKTTDEHYKIFKQEALYWIRKLGLLEWEWFFEHDEIEDRAQVVYNIENMMAIVTFSKDWSDLQPTPRLVRRCAFHEVQEVFLGTISIMAIQRNLDIGLLEGEVHKIIRTLENTFFKDDYARRYVHRKAQ